MIIKHYTLTILACVCLQVMACGQEKKNITSQPKEHDPLKGMTQGGNSVDLSKWDDKYNKYTAKCTKNFRFQLKDSSKRVNTTLSGIFFLDDQGKINKYRKIDDMNWNSIGKMFGITFTPNERVNNDNNSVKQVYNLSRVDKAKLIQLLKGVKLTRSDKVDKLPSYLELCQPQLFVNSEKIVLCTEIYFFDDYIEEEDKVSIGGRTLIEVFDIKGNRIFEYFDTDCSKSGIQLSEDFKYLLQEYDYFSGDGGGSLNSGFKIYYLISKEKIIDYTIAKDVVDYHIDIEVFTDNYLICKLSDDYSVLELIVFDIPTKQLHRKKYSESQAKSLSKAVIEINQKNIAFINKFDRKRILNDNLSTFNIIEK